MCLREANGTSPGPEKRPSMTHSGGISQGPRLRCPDSHLVAALRCPANDGRHDLMCPSAAGPAGDPSGVQFSGNSPVAVAVRSAPEDRVAYPLFVGPRHKPPRPYRVRRPSVWRYRGNATSGVLKGQHGGGSLPPDPETLLRRNSVVMSLQEAGDALDLPTLIAAQSQQRPGRSVVSDDIAHLDTDLGPPFRIDL